MTTTTDLAGRYLEVTPEQIDEGGFSKELTRKLREGIKDLQDHWDRVGFRAGKLEVSAKIVIEPVPDMKEAVRISHIVECKLPRYISTTEAKMANGRMIAQPSGTTKDDADQQRFIFDGAGEVTGEVNLTTGEVTEPPSDIAGSVGA